MPSKLWEYLSSNSFYLQAPVASFFDESGQLGRAPWSRKYLQKLLDRKHS